METVSPAEAYNLTEEEEKKEILRQYRGLLRVLKQKLKPGDKTLLRSSFEMRWKRIKPCAEKAANPIFSTQ